MISENCKIDFHSIGKIGVLGQILNFAPFINISLISALRGLETSPNIFKWGNYRFQAFFVALRPKPNFDPLSRLYDFPEL